MSNRKITDEMVSRYREKTGLLGATDAEVKDSILLLPPDEYRALKGGQAPAPKPVTANVVEVDTATWRQVKEVVGAAATAENPASLSVRAKRVYRNIRGL